MAESIPSFSQNNINGRISWFGGPHDATDSGHTASGGTTKEPGIAVYNRATLGGYWKVRAPNGKTAIVKQTDLGPAPWTGKKIDFTYSVLPQFGYSEGNFPTGSSASAQYLGKNLPQGTSAGTQQEPTMVPGQPGRTTEIPGFPATRGTRATTQLNFNTEAYQKARNEAEVNKTLLGLFGGKERGALRGVFPGTMPTIGQFLTSKTTPGTPGSPALAGKLVGEGGKAERAVRGRAASGNYVHPLPPGATIGRTDMGVDASMKPGDPIRAIGPGKVLGIYPNWYQGQPYLSYELTGGSHAGQVVYVAEQIQPRVKPGETLAPGRIIANYAPNGTGIETGFGTHGWQTLAQASGGYAEGQETDAGKKFRALLKELEGR